MLKRAPTLVRDGIAMIDLGNGYVATIDEADLILVSSSVWCSQPGKGSTRYAASGRTMMHRKIMGEPKGLFIDHINGDGLDNRRSNLRVCNNAENTRNQRKRAGTTSRFKGVCRSRKSGYWEAAIEKNGRAVCLGSYTDEVIAAKQYDRAARLMFGRFALTNSMLGLLPS